MLKSELLVMVTTTSLHFVGRPALVGISLLNLFVTFGRKSRLVIG
jgi:hypothetical protein